MKLTREQRRRFFARDWPVLAGKGKPPCEVGHVQHLSPRLWFEVTKVRLIPGGWRLIYKVYDDREEPFYLMPSSTSFPTNERGQMLESLPAEEEIGYTRNPKRRTIDPLRAVPPDVQNVIRMRARLEDAQRAETHEDRTKRDLRSLTAQIRETAIRMARNGVDPGPWLTDLQRQVNEQRGEVDEAA